MCFYFKQHFPEYKYDYAVKDFHTGDHKNAWEHRHGDKVYGNTTFWTLLIIINCLLLSFLLPRRLYAKRSRWHNPSRRIRVRQAQRLQRDRKTLRKGRTPTNLRKIRWRWWRRFPRRTLLKKTHITYHSYQAITTDNGSNWSLIIISIFIFILVVMTVCECTTRLGS